MSVSNITDKHMDIFYLNFKDTSGMEKCTFCKIYGTLFKAWLDCFITMIV